MKNITIILLCIIATYQSYSQNIGIKKNGLKLNTLTAACPFLMIAPDARGSSMGDAGAASTPDVNSLHWNPAKFAFTENKTGLSLTYSPWLRALVKDINLGYLSAYRKIDDKNTVAMSLRYFSLGDITFTDSSGSPIGQYRPNEFAADAAYSAKIARNFSLGIAVRYIYSNLTGGINVGGVESHPGRAVASDISGYYRKKMQVASQDAVWGFGFNFSNIGTKVSYTNSIDKDFLPMNFRLGSSFKFHLDEYNTIELLADINKLLVPTPPEYDSPGIIAAGMNPNRSVANAIYTSWYDAPGGLKEEFHEIMYSFGMEYLHDNNIAIRVGYFYEHPTKGNRKYLNFGFGLQYHAFEFDFAYLIPMEQRNPLENTMRFTLMCNFDSFKKKKETPTEAGKIN